MQTCPNDHSSDNMVSNPNSDCPTLTNVIYDRAAVAEMIE